MTRWVYVLVSAVQPVFYLSDHIEVISLSLIACAIEPAHWPRCAGPRSEWLTTLASIANPMASAGFSILTNKPRCFR